MCAHELMSIGIACQPDVSLEVIAALCKFWRSINEKGRLIAGLVF